MKSLFVHTSILTLLLALTGLRAADGHNHGAAGNAAPKDGKSGCCAAKEGGCCAKTAKAEAKAEGGCCAKPTAAAAKARPYPLDTCVVSGEKLGDHGKPVVFTDGDREVKLCCKSCLKDWKTDREALLKKLDAADAAKAAPAKT